MPVEYAEVIEERRPVIRGECEDFVCNVCRTKAGWPHQIWCEWGDLTEPGCEDCGYYNERKHGCSHPVRKMKRRGRVNERG